MERQQGYEAFPHQDWEPFGVRIMGEDCLLTPYNTLIFLFRDAPDISHLMVGRGYDKPPYVIFNAPKLIQGMLKDKFHKEYGWHPKVVIEDTPPDTDMEVYYRYQMEKLEEELGNG